MRTDSFSKVTQRLAEVDLLTFFRSLSAENRVVADEGLAWALKDTFKRFARFILTEDDLKADPPAGGAHVTVMFAQRARARERAVRRAYPDANIQNFIADVLIPKLISDQIAVAERGLTEVLPANGPARLSSILYGAPGSEVDTLAIAGASAGLGVYLHPFSHFLCEWADIADDFSILRYLRAFVLQTAAQVGAAPIHLVLYSDQAVRLMKASPSRAIRYFQFLKRLQIPVCGFLMRDRLRQIVIALYTARRGARSVHLMNDQQRTRLKPQPYALQHLLPLIPDCLSITVEVTRRFGQYDNKLVLTYEDFRRAPGEVLATYSRFLNRKPKDNVVLPDFELVDRMIPALSDHALRLGWDLVDELGLHVNAEGTTLPFADRFIRRDAGRSTVKPVKKNK